MSQAQLYTQEQMDIALLKNTQDGIAKEMYRLGMDMNALRAETNALSSELRTELHSVRSELRTELHSMRDEIRSQGHWNIGLILGIYGMIGAAALAKVLGVL